MTQKERILNYLKEHKTITQLEAINVFWDWRLSAKIYQLKKEGYPIKTEMIKVKRADGSDAYVSKYTLMEVK
jgi:hypothetical protein